MRGKGMLKREREREKGRRERNESIGIVSPESVR